MGDVISAVNRLRQTIRTLRLDSNVGVRRIMTDQLLVVCLCVSLCVGPSDSGADDQRHSILSEALQVRRLSLDAPLYGNYTFNECTHSAESALIGTLVFVSI